MKQDEVITSNEITKFIAENEIALEKIQNLYGVYISELMDLLLTQFANEKISSHTAYEFLLLWSVKTKNKDLEYLKKTLNHIEEEIHNYEC